MHLGLEGKVLETASEASLPTSSGPFVLFSVDNNTLLGTNGQFLFDFYNLPSQDRNFVVSTSF